MASTPLNASRKVLDFYKNKSIAHSYNFGVTLNFDRWATYSTRLYESVEHQYIKYYISRIKEYHIVSVDFPINTFNRSSVNIGTLQYSYPVLASEQALDIKLTFSEDNRGTIVGFIAALANTVMSKGAHVPPGYSILGDIIVSLYDDQGQIYGKYVAHDVFFLGGTGLNNGYDSNDAIQYDITFGTNFISYEDSGMELKELHHPPFTIGLQSFM